MSRSRRVLRLVALIAPFGCAAALGLPMCPWAIATGKPCPGCGMTRAALALLRGDLDAASAFNPTALVTVPASAGLALFFAASYIYDGKMRANDRIPRALGIGTIAALTAVWIARAFGAFGGMVAV